MATQTISITNFSGMLTRVENGPLNSGFAKFTTSWGYDPFSQPGNLTWNYQASTIGLISSTMGLVLAGGRVPDSNYYHTIDSTSRFYAIEDSRRTINIGPNTYGSEPLADRIVSVVGSFSSITGTFTYGASMIPVNSDRFLISSDSRIMMVYINPSGITVSSQSSVFGTASSVTSGIPHPLAEFQGNVYYGNGNNIGQVDPDLGSYGTITDGTKLSPALPAGLTVTDLDVTPEGDYLLITGSYAPPPAFGDPFVPFASGELANKSARSYVFYWNGSDEAATAFRTLPEFPAPALSTFLDHQYTVMQDTFGMGLMEGNSKLLTLPNNLTPTPNAITANGTFLTWMSIEGIGDINASNSVYGSVTGSLYYFGRQDDQSPVGLWRMLRVYPSGDQVTVNAPFNQVINNFTQFANLVLGFGKHYLSTRAVDTPTYSNDENKLLRFVLNPAQNTRPLLGVYETQTQLFSKRISTSQIRVYCDPTVEGNSFQLDLIGSNGDPIPDGTYTYSYGDIVDPQDGSASVQRVNFPGSIKTQYSLGVRITNTGTTNMVIRKIELDISEEGK